MNEIVRNVESIDKEMASHWLESNHLNRPVRNRHVEYLARQMAEGRWQVNGQAIIISEKEDILDGQHRLLAVVQSGVTIKSLVVYGIANEAFKTIDTGALRTGSDALHVWFKADEHSIQVEKAVAAAVPWCLGLERKIIREQRRLPNVEVVEYLTAHPTLWRCAETLCKYPRETRQLSTGIGTGLFEIFQRRNQRAAMEFMRKIYLGDGLAVGEPEYALRTLFALEQKRSMRFSATTKARMVVKAWNYRRRNLDGIRPSKLEVTPKDPDTVEVL